MKVLAEVVQTFGFSFEQEPVVEIANADGADFIFLDGTPWIFETTKGRGPTLRSLLIQAPTKGKVVVDMGAVRFMANGADVMAPGIVDADENIVEGDIVWVGDERHFRPMVVGRALMSGPEMKSSLKGKSIKMLHHVGDEIWEVEN